MGDARWGLNRSPDGYASLARELALQQNSGTLESLVTHSGIRTESPA